MDKIKLPTQRIDARFAASEADRESRTVPMTWYTGAKVVQFSWDKGVHNLQLSMEPKHVRLGALNSGTAPFTKGHRSSNDVDAVIGKIESARLEGANGTAIVRFSKRQDAEPYFQDVLDGILQNVSLEAALYKLKEITKEGDQIKTFLALDWEPTAVALVAQGADPNAHINAAADPTTECEIEFCKFAARATSPQEALTMPDTMKTGEEARTKPEAVNAEAILKAERERTASLTSAHAQYVQMGGDPKDLNLSEHLSAGTEIDTFRKLAFDALAQKSAANPTREHSAKVTRDERDTFLSALPQAILAVQGVRECKPEDPGYEFRGMASRGLLRIAEECVTRMGKNPARMSPDQVAQLALHSTSDLPLILGATADSSLRAGYDAVPSQWPRLAARRVVQNFRPQYELMTGLSAGFPQVPESGEYKTAVLTEGRESYRVYTYGNKLLVTRQVIINDSLGALTDVPRRMGAAAAYRQADLFWAHVVANSNLSDNSALFVAGHANLIDPGTAISVDSLGVARKTLALQTNSDGQVIGLTPQYMVVPAGKEQIARQYLSNAYNPTAQTSINPWVGMAELIVEPRLDASSATAWYLLANPAIAPVYVHVYLAGNEGVFAQSETTVDVDGFKWLMRFDFGVGSVDYRGAVKNLGQ